MFTDLVTALAILENENRVDLTQFENKDELGEIIVNILKGLKMTYSYNWYVITIAHQ